MRIVWLFERTDQLWGGVKVALTDANWLADQGHEVTVVSRSGPPQWMPLRAEFRQVDKLSPAALPPCDVVIATYWTTISCAIAVTGAKAIHFCQGYEGDGCDDASVRDRIEAMYRSAGLTHITIAPHLTTLLRERFGKDAHEIVYAIDHDTHFPGPARQQEKKVRVGLVGPYEIAWKDIATGIAACRLAAAAGLQLELVRVTNTQPHPLEQNLPFPVEWHQQVPPDRMGDIYRSLDVFLGTSRGKEEGFFLPAVEAMACGVPCVLTDIPCFRAHGDHQYALFVPPQDPTAMAEALVVAGRTPDVAAALRSGGIAAAQRYTQAAHGSALLAVFERIVGTTAERSPREVPRAVATADGTAAANLAADWGGKLRSAGQQFAGLGDHMRAAQFLAAAHLLVPTDVDLATEAAWSLHLAGDSSGALRTFDSLVRDGVDTALVHERRAQLLDGMGEPRAAAQALRAAIAAGRRSADTYNHLGVALYRTGDVAGARSSFERALLLDPHHVDARANAADLQHA